MKKNKFWIKFLIICFISAISASAEEKVHNWKFAGWYGGGCYPNIEFDPYIRNRVYLVSDVAGIWRSDNLGEKWEFITNGLDNGRVALLVISPIDSNILYAGTLHGLYRSIDAGRSWKLCDTMNGEVEFDRPVNYRSISASRLNVNEVCIGTLKGSIFCSNDSGQNWQSLGHRTNPFNDDNPITSLSFGSDENFLYASSQKGLMRYSFKSENWFGLRGTPSPVTDFVISQQGPHVIYVAGQEKLYMSYDEGETWKASKVIPKGYITRVSINDELNPPLIVVAWEKDWEGGVLRSYDNGLSWESIDRNMHVDQISNPTRIWAMADEKITSIKINPMNNRCLFRTDWWGVFRSDDDGNTWQEKIIGAPNTVGSGLYINQSGDIYVATMDDGLMRSEDGGRNYEALFPVGSYDKNLYGHVWRVTEAGKNDDTIIATSSPWGIDINQVLMSQDGGKKFEIIREGLPTQKPINNTVWEKGYPRGLAVDEADPDTVYLSIDGDDGGGIFVSHDAGGHWIRLKNQPDSVKIYHALAVDPTDSKRIVVGTCGKFGGIYISEDSGNSWKQIFSKMNWVFDVTISRNGIIYIAGDEKGPVVYSSQDHGKTWELSHRFSLFGSADALAIDKKNPERLAVSVVQWNQELQGKIYMTQDSGKNWYDVTGDLPQGTGAAAMAFSPDGKFLYISRYAGSVYKMKL